MFFEISLSDFSLDTGNENDPRKERKGSQAHRNCWSVSLINTDVQIKEAGNLLKDRYMRQRVRSILYTVNQSQKKKTR